MIKALQEAYEMFKAKRQTLETLMEREQALKAQIDELSNERLNALADGDAKKLERVDKQLDAKKRELEIVQYQRRHKTDHDHEQCADVLARLKRETAEMFAKKKQEDEKLRAEIEKAKRTYLRLLAEHRELSRECEAMKNEVNEVVNQLSRSVRQRIEQLRREAQALDRQIYEKAPASGRLSEAQEAEIEQLRTQKSDRLREVARLEAQIATINNPIRDLASYRDENYQTVYFVHEDEQKGIIKQ